MVPKLMKYFALHFVSNASNIDCILTFFDFALNKIGDNNNMTISIYYLIMPIIFLNVIMITC